MTLRSTSSVAENGMLEFAHRRHHVGREERNKLISQVSSSSRVGESSGEKQFLARDSVMNSSMAAATSTPHCLSSAGHFRSSIVSTVSCTKTLIKRSSCSSFPPTPSLILPKDGSANILSKASLEASVEPSSSCPGIEPSMVFNASRNLVAHVIPSAYATFLQGVLHQRGSSMAS